MKKWLLFVFACVFILAGCSTVKIKEDILEEPNFSGRVVDVHDRSILVEVDEGEDERRSSDLISVSLDAELEESQTTFAAGDPVRVYYDGSIAESYPAQVNNVYYISLIE